MKEYQVEVTEIRTTIITVRANSDKEAEESAREGYDSNEYEVKTLDSVSFDVLI